MVVFLANGPYMFLSFFDPRLAFSPLLCQVGAFTGRYTTTVSMYLLTVMSLSRFYSLAKPLEYRVRVTASKANKVCIGAWVVTFLQSLTPVLGWGKYTAIKGQCYCALDSSEHMSNWFVHLLLAFALPLAFNSWIFARTLKLVNRRIRDSKKGKILRGPKVKKTCGLNKGKQECTSSVNKERNTDNRLSNENATFNKRNLDQPDKGPQKSEVVDLEVVVRVNEETKEEPAFVNQGFEDEDANYNPADGIKINARVNEEHKSDEIEVVNQGIEIQSQKVSTNERDHDISVISVERASCEKERQNRKHTQQEEESDKMKKTQKHKEKTVLTNERDHDISVSSVERASCENGRQSKKNSQPENESDKMKKTQNHKDKTSKSQDQNYELKINMIVSLLFLAYVIGCGPTYVVWTWFALDPKSVPRTAFVIFRLFAGAQSVANPFIYGFMNTEIRADVLALWKNAPKWVFRKQ